MTFDRVKLFKLLVQRFGALDGVQQSVVAALLDEFARRKLTDVRWLAYMLATAWHEARWRSVREGDVKGVGISDAKARAIVAAYCKRKGKKNYAAAHPVTGQSYYARGLPGLTHYENYLKFEKTLGMPLTTQPDLALLVPVTVKIMFEGMTTGVTAKDSFTKFQLHDFFNDTTDNPVGARRIINGIDKAKEIAAHHHKLLEALEATRLPDAVVQTESDAREQSYRTDDGAIAVPPSGTAGGGIAAGGAVIVGGGGAVAHAAGLDWKLIVLVGGFVLGAAVIAGLVWRVVQRKNRSKANGQQ